ARACTRLQAWNTPARAMTRDSRMQFLHRSGHGGLPTPEWRIAALDDGAAQAACSVIEHDRLPRRDRTLWLGERDNAVCTIHAHHAVLVDLPVADLCRAAEFARRSDARDPVQTTRCQAA